MRLLLLALLVLPFDRLPAQAADQKVAAFDRYATQAAKDWGAVGLAVAVVKDGRTIFAKGYGVRELGKPGVVDSATLFAIGSTTKAITAAAVGMLVDDGKLGWDDPVINHLPGFQLGDPYVTREITVRDLLTHRAGLANGDILWYRTDNSPAEILRRARFIPSAYSIRSSFVYQNVMYAAAGAVEAASGMSWARFLETRIFRPLGMTGTVATLAETAGLPNLAVPHYRIRGEPRVITNASVDPVAAAGSIWSGVADMARWAAFMLDSGRVDGKPLLKPETWAELLKPQALLPPGAFYPSQRLTKPSWMSYGMGWFQQDYQGRTVQFHTGSIDGMVAIIGLIPSARLGVYVLGNLDHVEVRHPLMLRAFDTWLGTGARDWSGELLALYRGLEADGDSALARRARDRQPNAAPTLPLGRYAGRYADSLVGSVEIGEAEGRLTLSRGPFLKAKLDHWQFDTFQAVWENEWQGTDLVTFAIGADGSVEGLRYAGRRLGRVR